MSIQMRRNLLEDLHSQEGVRVRVALAAHLEELRGEAQTIIESPNTTDAERRDSAAQLRIIRDLGDCLRWDPKTHAQQRREEHVPLPA